MVGVEQWAEIRRLVLVEQRSQRQVAKSLGLARDTVARALASDAPPRYERAPVVSKVDPFKEWICEQLIGDPSIPSLRLRELAGELGSREPDVLAGLHRVHLGSPVVVVVESADPLGVGGGLVRLAF